MQKPRVAPENRPSGGPGMREMVSTTAALYGQGAGGKVALITEQCGARDGPSVTGRLGNFDLSNVLASMKLPCALVPGHASPNRRQAADTNVRSETTPLMGLETRKDRCVRPARYTPASAID